MSTRSRTPVESPQSRLSLWEASTPSSTQAPSIHQALAALRLRDDYNGQIVHMEELPPRAAQYDEPRPGLSSELRQILTESGVHRLYSHQVETLHAARKNRNVVTVTGTASGKTLAFLLPILEALEQDPSACVMLLYPTKALAQDQLRGIEALLQRHPKLRGAVTAGVFDGDTAQGTRTRIRKQANLVLTNPDMLHRGILPYHSKWHRVLSHLTHVVVDEIHSYRGIFGSNVALVMRRLRRIAEHYDSSPQFLCSSATIQNPKQLAENLVGAPFFLVNRDGAPRGSRIFCLWNPPVLDRASMERRSGNVEACRIFATLVSRNIPTITFTKARVVAELIYRYAREALEPEGKQHTILPYRSGYLPKERRDIEQRLFCGKLRGVVSTNALELGIDIGSLDASVIVGFPGTIASVWQQAGRSGRSNKTSLTILVGYNDPIDQYLLHHPSYFFDQTPEAAILDAENPYVLANHLSCAAFELPLEAGDGQYFSGPSEAVRSVLRDAGDLTPIRDRDHWASSQFPARHVDLRTISDETYTILDTDNQDAVLGTVDAISAPELIYPEAIYLHRGETYFVSELDLEKKLAHVTRVQADYYTQPVLDTHLKELSERETSNTRLETVRFVDADVSWATTMFKKIEFGSQDSIGYKNLDLPWQTLNTVAVAWTPSRTVLKPLLEKGWRPGEALQGLRNVSITVFPTLAMCDRADLGGVVQGAPHRAPTLYLYDRYPGGLGFSESGYRRFEELLTKALELIEACRCEQGCPSCVGMPVLIPPQHQDPGLHKGRPIPDKDAARLLLRSVLNA